MSAQLNQSKEMRLRPMHPEDVVSVMAIERLAYTHPWTEGIFRDCLRIGYCCWVCDVGGEVVGYGVMSVGAGESHILNLCVRADARRHGYARSMLAHLLQLAREHGAENAFLEVRPSNEGAIRLYHYMGFDEIGRRRGYYPAAGGREDALVLARSL